MWKPLIPMLKGCMQMSQMFLDIYLIFSALLCIPDFNLLTQRLKSHMILLCAVFSILHHFQFPTEKGSDESDIKQGFRIMWHCMFDWK